MLSPQKITETSTKFFTSLNQGDIESWLGTLASDVRTYEPVGTPANEGHEGVLSWLQNMSDPFESMSLEVGDIYAVGNSAAIIWRGQAKLKSGGEFSFKGIDVHEYNDDGKIQTVKGYFDPTPMMAALGG